MNKNKRNLMIAIIASVVILSIAGFRIVQIEQNHETNKPILDECIDNFGTVVIEKEYFWSLSSATCVKN